MATGHSQWRHAGGGGGAVRGGPVARRRGHRLLAHESFLRADAAQCYFGLVPVTLLSRRRAPWARRPPGTERPSPGFTAARGLAAAGTYRPPGAHGS